MGWRWFKSWTMCKGRVQVQGTGLHVPGTTTLCRHHPARPHTHATHAPAMTQISGSAQPCASSRSASRCAQ